MAMKFHSVFFLLYIKFYYKLYTIIINFNIVFLWLLIPFSKKQNETQREKVNAFFDFIFVFDNFLFVSRDFFFCVKLRKPNKSKFFSLLKHKKNEKNIKWVEIQFELSCYFIWTSSLWWKWMKQPWMDFYLVAHLKS